ncbi:MAG: uncharacterized protein JWM42_3100, partial [Burkholderia sp.]|nr:uncharacterized protein [Burkholderia sp.]
MAYVNLLLNALGQSASDLLVPALEPVQLKTRDNLVAAGEQSEWVYFVEDGLISLVSEYEPGHLIEIAMVGREGLFDIGLVLGDEVAA